MKKLIALALALVMALSMGSVAFAASAEIDEDEFESGDMWGNLVLDEVGIEIDLGMGEIYPENDDDPYTIIIAPGSKLYVDIMKMLAAAEEDFDAYRNDVANVLKSFKLDYKVTKGAALVKDISYKNGKIVFELKENYTLGDVKDLQFTITITAKKDLTAGDLGEGQTNTTVIVNKGDTIKLTVGEKGIDIETDIEVPNEGQEGNGNEQIDRAPAESSAPLLPIKLGVANAVVLLDGAEEADDAEVKDITGWPRNNIIYQINEEEGGYVKFGGTTSLFQILANMNAEERLFMHLLEDDKDIIDALTEKNKDATLHTYTLEGNVAFRNDAEFTVQADYADQYVIYAYNNGQLTKVDTEWDSIEGVYKWTAKEMTTYVISDVELVAADETTKNPDTGANDMMGIAAALAVVSMTAAAAVSLKK